MGIQSPYLNVCTMIGKGLYTGMLAGEKKELTSADQIRSKEGCNPLLSMGACSSQ